MTERISVVIPTFNRWLFLREALESIRAQTRPPDDVIVVDDGSTDGTASRDLGPDVRFFTQPNRGPSAARNRGIREATGTLIAFLDSDDRWTPERLESQLPAFDDPAVLLCYGREEARDEESRLVHLRPRRLPAGEVLEELVGGNFVPTSTVLARRDSILMAGGFEEDMTHSEDWDLWLRLAERGRFAAVDAVLSCYRFHPGQLIENREALSRGRLRVIERALDRSGEHPRILRRLEKRLGDRLFRLGRRLLRDGRVEEGRRLLSRARELPGSSRWKSAWLLLRGDRRETVR